MKRMGRGKGDICRVAHKKRGSPLECSKGDELLFLVYWARVKKEEVVLVMMTLIVKVVYNMVFDNLLLKVITQQTNTGV